MKIFQKSNLLMVTLVALNVFTWSVLYANSDSDSKNHEEYLFLSEMESQVLVQLNFARTQPLKYAQEILVPMRNLYKDGYLMRPGEIRIVTNEGIAALEEAIEFMENASPVGSLMVSAGMSHAARDHVSDQSSTGKTGHDGSDGSNPFSRMDRYGKWKVTAGENIGYGDDFAESVVASLIIDDGVAGRGHRGNILNPDFIIIGLASGGHLKYGSMFVQNFAGGYSEK